MSNDVFPADVRGLTFTVRRTPEFSTIVQTAPNFMETRIPTANNPRWHWEFVYNYLYDDPYNLLQGFTQTDLKILMGFFMRHMGQWDSFLFEDPDDHTLGPALTGVSPATPNLDAELSVLHQTDLDIYYSPIQRILGGATYGFAEDISDLNGPLEVYDNGVLQTENTDYSIEGPGLGLPGYSHAGLYLLWTAEPTGPVTVEGEFYHRVRFESDALDFEKFMQNLWTLGGETSQRGSGSIKIMTTYEYAVQE